VCGAPAAAGPIAGRVGLVPGAAAGVSGRVFDHSRAPDRLFHRSECCPRNTRKAGTFRGSNWL